MPRLVAQIQRCGVDRTLNAVVRGVRIVVSEMRPSGALPKQQLGAATGAGAVAVQVHWKCVRWLHEIVAVQAASGRTRPLAMLGVRPYCFAGKLGF